MIEVNQTRTNMRTEDLLDTPDLEERSDSLIPGFRRFYFESIKGIRLLSRDEEYDLGVKSSKGDKVATQKLVYHNLKFVAWKVLEFLGYLRYDRALSFEDLFQHGSIGLWKAAKNYRPRKDVKFLSYAVFSVDEAIMTAIRNNRLIRVKSVGRKLIKKYDHAFDLITHDVETNYALIEDVADEMKIDEEKVRKICLWKELLRVDNLDQLASEEDGAICFDILDKDALEPDSAAHETSLKEFLEIYLGKLSNLTTKEQEIVTMYFGLADQEKVSMEDIAKMYDLQRERVRQIKEKALRRLRWGAGRLLLEVYLDDPYVSERIKHRLAMSLRSIFVSH